MRLVLAILLLRGSLLLLWLVRQLEVSGDYGGVE